MAWSAAAALPITINLHQTEKSNAAFFMTQNKKTVPKGDRFF
jgi:hypothetical protein